MLQNGEREALRRLVDEYMQLATLPVQKEKIALWKALNRSEMRRPMVVIDQLPWDELRCEALAPLIADPYWRGVETELRQQIYKYRHFPVDMVLDPMIPIPKVLRHSGYGITAETVWLGSEDSTAKSQHYENLISSLEDVDRIIDYTITLDEEETARRGREAEQLFGDLAPILWTGHTFHLGIWDFISQLMGVENVYFAMVDEPELLHALIERLTVSTLRAIGDANACGAHNDGINTCHCSYIYTDDLLPDSGQGKGPRSENCWAYGLAQLFTSVSPEQFAEFELPYIRRLAEPFGRLYYGCCDRLDDRLELVKRIPNVRKVSCSPWSDREQFAAKIGPKLIMSNKPTPALLAAAGFDEGQIREDLAHTCRLARENHVNLELILKDISTVQHQPERLTRWAEIAMEVVEG